MKYRIVHRKKSNGDSYYVPQFRRFLRWHDIECVTILKKQVYCQQYECVLDVLAGQTEDLARKLIDLHKTGFFKKIEYVYKEKRISLVAYNNIFYKFSPVSSESFRYGVYLYRIDNNVLVYEMFNTLDAAKESIDNSMKGKEYEKFKEIIKVD